MKVKCIASREKLTLTINTAYVVYGGEFSLDGSNKKYDKFIIENDNGSVMPYNASSFDIVVDIDDEYVTTNLKDEKFEFIHNEISYEGFWSMFYDDVKSTINHFNVCKKWLYIKQLNDDEIKAKLTSYNIIERDFMANVLSEYKNDCFIKFVADFCNEELNKWINYIPLESLFKYLGTFKTSVTDEFFENYLSQKEKGHKRLDNIMYEYFNKN